MGIIKTKGLVIARHDMKENDLMITLLTQTNGKINCAVKGAKRPKSNLMAGTQFLCFGEFVIYQGVSSYTINSCEPIEIFYNIRMDIEKLEYVAKITKIINDVTHENDLAYNILQLTLNTIYMLANSERELEFIYTVFKTRLLKELGYTPEIKKCVKCGNKDGLEYFNISRNGVECLSCGKFDKEVIQINNIILRAIKYIMESEPKKIFSFTVSEINMIIFKNVIKLYFNRVLDKEYK